MAADRPVPGRCRGGGRERPPTPASDLPVAEGGEASARGDAFAPEAAAEAAAEAAPEPRVPGAPSRALVARRAGVVSIAVMASRVLGLVREQVFAIFFGAGRELDAFITAFRIPNLMRDLFAEGALSSAFVTTFTSRLELEGKPSAWRLASGVLTALVVIVAAITAAGIAFAPSLVAWIAPGFAAVAGKTALTIRMTRIMFPFLLMVALAAVAMGILNACDRFGVPASASSFFNLGAILGGLGCASLLAPDYIRSVALALVGRGAGAMPGGSAAAARAITGMAVGTLVGGTLQFLVQVPSLARVGFRYRPRGALTDPGVRQVMRLMGPATVGAAAVQVNVFVNNNFASYLGNGPVSWLNIAFRFMQLPIGLFGVALATVTLPLVSRHAARADLAALRGTVAQALELVALLCLPAAVGLALFGVPIIGLVYEHGRFTPADTAAAAQALAGYSLGLAGYAGIKVLVPTFYALDDARTPMLVSLFSIATNYALNWTFVRQLGFGHLGLALSTSLVALANFVLLFVLLRRRIGPGEEARLASTALRILVATATMAAAALAADHALAPALPASRFLAHAARLAVVIPLSVVVFWVAARVLRLPIPRRLPLPWRRQAKRNPGAKGRP